MKLITVENYEIRISEEAYLIKAFRDLWKKDKSKTKDLFFTQMGYIYYLLDPRSNYNYIVDYDSRKEAILIQEGLKDFKETPDLIKAMEVYSKMITTTSTLLLEDIRIALDKLRAFLREFKIEDFDTAKLSTDMRNIATLISNATDLSKKLRETERIVNQEIEEVGKAKGNQVNKTIMDGI